MFKLLHVINDHLHRKMNSPIDTCSNTKNAVECTIRGNILVLTRSCHVTEINSKRTVSVIPILHTKL
jgi:hypothetical protein